jgi:regulatory protein
MAGRARTIAEPDQAALHEAALRHMARYGATQAGLVRVLDRRVDRWARSVQAPPERLAALRALNRQIAARLAASGVVDDAAFATARAARLARAGKSRRAIAAHLSARGIEPETGRAVLPGAEAELCAALRTARRRRLGAFGPAVDAEARRRQLAVLARAGFGEGVARRALAMERAEADALLTQAHGEAAAT